MQLQTFEPATKAKMGNVHAWSSQINELTIQSNDSGHCMEQVSNQQQGHEVPPKRAHNS
jgi:hypothetical protein